MKTIGVLTSGGDSPGMNACIRAITRTAIKNNLKVVGIMRGYQGLIDGEFVELTARFVGNILQLGGTVLKTSRSAEFKTKAGFEKALENIKKAKIDVLFVIGGDGSFNGALSLAKAGVKVIAIPASIDNDLKYTDYTIGFDTAVNTIVSLVNNIRDTSMAHERITVVEVMGAYCGDIALNAGVASGADYILVPEVKFEPKKLYEKLMINNKNGKLCNIIVANENVMSSEKLAKEITKNTGLEVRFANVGHIQRGGSPTANDRIRATMFGIHAVSEMMQGKYNFAVGVRAEKVMSVPIERAFDKYREFDKSLYDMIMEISY